MFLKNFKKMFNVSKKTILRAVVTKGKPIFKEISELTDLYYKSYTREKFVISIEHRCFFDTGIFRVPEIFRPNWIGTVRDPVDRYASIYYYRSKPLKERPPWLQLVKSKRFKKIIWVRPHHLHLH